jgi:hypothetical protein
LVKASKQIQKKLSLKIGLIERSILKCDFFEKTGIIFFPHYIRAMQWIYSYLLHQRGA